MIIEVFAYIFVLGLLAASLAVLYSLTKLFCAWVNNKTKSIDFSKKKD